MQLIWFRTDLRTIDNTALRAAAQRGPVIGVFLFTPEQWQGHHDAPAKVDFVQQHVAALSQALAALHIPLLIRTTPLWKDVPQVIQTLCAQHGVTDVHINEEYGANETTRDREVTALLQVNQITLHRYLDKILFAPGSILNQSGKYFQVFTQFKKQCYARLYQHVPVPAPPPACQSPLGIPADPLPATLDGYAPCPHILAHWPIGEDTALDTLAAFIEARVCRYDETRDFPALHSTSRLSAYLALGTVSIRQCLSAAIHRNQGEIAEGNHGIATWVSELLWREFYSHILTGFPHVSHHQPFKLATNRIAWRHAPEELRAWQEGKTGFPLIDAAMRQLAATGWMHNRLRMVVAMFLTKNLLIDWREGERWFMQHLVDGDLAANNGGWQWSASTGTDSVPYFRIFNPVTQSERFDPEGDFIRQWIPALAHIKTKYIHNPYGDKHHGTLDYPRPMVDLAASRERALDAFKRTDTST